tara:strand:- start:69 stop:707 length:639 start_codon:yes stop_codon:yes gene_type:complete
MSQDNNNSSNSISEIESLLKLNETYKNKMELQKDDLLVKREIITGLEELNDLNSEKINELKLKNSISEFKVNIYKDLNKRGKYMINRLYKGCFGLIMFYSYILIVGVYNFVGQVAFVSNILYQVSFGIASFCGIALVIIMTLFFIILLGPFFAIVGYLNSLCFTETGQEKYYGCKLVPVILLPLLFLYSMGYLYIYGRYIANQQPKEHNKED